MQGFELAPIVWRDLYKTAHPRPALQSLPSRFWAASHSQRLQTFSSTSTQLRFARSFPHSLLRLHLPLLQFVRSQAKMANSITGPGEFRFSPIQATDHAGDLWIVAILTATYSCMVAVVRNMIKRGTSGVDDLVFNLALVRTLR